MRQVVIILSLIGSFTIFAVTIDLFDTMFMFLLFGVVPGRSEPIPANQMLLIYTVATVAVVAYALRARVIAALNLLRVNLPRRSNAS